MASVRYFYQLSNHKQQSSAVLKQKVYQLNNILEQSVQAVDGIHGLAQYYLKRPAEISGYLPKLSQENKMFYLDIKEHDVVKEGRRLNSNITGTGNVSDFTADKKLEITMANALTPAFVSAQKIIKQATWFYYISLDQFVSLYPWVDRDVWHFNSATLKNPLYQKMKKFTEINNQAIWSAPYLDPAGTGRKTSLGKAVFYQQKQKRNR